MATPRSAEALAVGFEGTTLPPDVLEMASGPGGLGGLILFSRNCPDLETVLRLTAAARALGPDVLVLVDHEGGRVHRLPPPFTRFPPPGVVGAVGDPALAGAVARAMARELRAAGFDSGLAPVVDCRTDRRSTVVGDRAYGRDPAAVAGCGVAAVQAMLAEGLIPVVKHFPGHGRTPVDSHLALPEVQASRRALDRTELRPFRRALAAGCPAVLVAHVRYHALDPARPASLSPPIIGDLLRGEMGFDGLVLSDDLEMQAVADAWGIGPAARLFLAAGGDLALACRRREARESASAEIGAAVTNGQLELGPARRRRAALRRLVEVAGPRPPLEVIGCAEHRELAEEVVRRPPARRPTGQGRRGRPVP